MAQIRVLGEMLGVCLCIIPGKLFPEKCWNL